MTTIELPLSKTPVQRHVILSGITVLIACTLVTYFFHRFITIAPNLQTLLLTLLWAGLVGLWLLGSIVALKTWPKTTYTLTDDALRIRKKGLFGKNNEQLFRYDAILSVASNSRDNGAYGTLTLTLDQQNEVVMNGIKRPEEQAALIKKKATETSRS